MKAFSKVEFYDRVLWKNYLAVIGVVGTIVTLISFFVTAEDIDRFSEKQLAAFLVAGLVLIDRKSTRLNSSHLGKSRMPSSA